MITREKWGQCPYDVSAPNEPVDADTLMAYCQDAEECGEAEMPRLADIATELALHPEVARSDRLRYADIALVTLDALVEQTAPEIEPRIHIAHALLPGVYKQNSREGERYRLESARRVAKLGIYFETYFADTKLEGICGPAFELLETAALRTLDFAAITSVRRQDETAIKVDGWHYKWDTTATTVKGKHVGGNYFLQEKHGASHVSSAKYHPDIIVRKLRKERSEVGTELNVFELLRHVTGRTSRAADIEMQYDLYIRGLNACLREHGPSRPKGTLLVRPYVG